jgi:hypothetical protein
MSSRILVSALPAPTSPLERRIRWTRLGVATVSALSAAVLMRISWSGSGTAALWVPTAFLALSTLLLHDGVVGSQLIARSAWWATLVLGTLIAVAGRSGSDGDKGMLLAMTTGTALLAMGRLGLDEGDESAFRPVAFRTTLTLGMIMAVADAQALGLFGALKLQDGGWEEDPSVSGLQAVLLLLSAGALVVAITGLYRLRVWGLLLATVCAAGVAVLSVTDVYGLPSPLRAGMALTSTVQVLLPVPLLVAIFRGRPVAPSNAPSRLARIAPAVLVALMMAGSAASVILGRPFRF